jgi:hypothetical protein
VNPIKEPISQWGQWDLNIAGKWVQSLKKGFFATGQYPKPDRAEVFHAEGNARL